jgi:anti-sigma regulatory factor (Ser/Thr protein kinase)
MWNETKKVTYKIEGLTEDKVYRDIVIDFIRDVPNPAKECFEYAFMEMMNNAIEHSGGTEVEISLFKDDYSAIFIIKDNGIGIFTKVAEALNLDEKRHAILELAKGKFTTDPKSHSGEGIFFSSKCADSFHLGSDGIRFITNPNEEKLEPEEKVFTGTCVAFRIKTCHTQTLQELFKQYTDAPESYGFIKTVIPIQLLEHGNEAPIFVSRSQARRLLTRIERFKVVHLDFTGIYTIGQGFSDEVFRVFKNNHPNVELVPINCSEAVYQMIQHVLEYK